MSSVVADSSTDALSSSRNSSCSSSMRFGDSSSCGSRLTADVIIKECIRSGYYRNPTCNDVLYLHHKGITEIDPNAFDMYTETKVLWLEGNGLTSLACGNDYVQVKPPKVKKLFQEESEEESEDDTAKKVGRSSETTFDHQNEENGATVPGQSAHYADPTALLEPCLSTPTVSCSGAEVAPGYVKEAHEGTTPKMPNTNFTSPSPSILPENNTVLPKKKDIFSSLYKTVRQLYLHNNVLREMPDLSRFQRLDAVNLSNNFFPAVRPCCPYWEEKMREFKKRSASMSTSSVNEMPSEGNGGRVEMDAKVRVTVMPATDILCSGQEDAETNLSTHTENESTVEDENDKGVEERSRDGEEKVGKKGKMHSSPEVILHSYQNSKGVKKPEEAKSVSKSPSLLVEGKQASTFHATSVGTLATTGRDEKTVSSTLGSPGTDDFSTLWGTRVVPAEEGAAHREVLLQEWGDQVQEFFTFCPHQPLVEEFSGKKWNDVCPMQRCPCSSLRTLNLSGNHLESFEDLCGLLCYKNLSVLDLSQNHIKDGEMLLLILKQMKNLRCLKLNGNPAVRLLRRYRKTVLARCTQLVYLDDLPVFEEERRMVNAWAVGGDKGEEEERKMIKKEKAEKEKKRLDDFRKLIARSQRKGDVKGERQGNAVKEGDAGASHAQYIEAITTREALEAIAAEEQDESSSTSSEEGSFSNDTSEGSHHEDNSVHEIPSRQGSLGKKAKNESSSTYSPSPNLSHSSPLGAGNAPVAVLGHSSDKGRNNHDEDEVFIPS